MLTWLTTFAGAKAAGFLRAHLFEIILILLVVLAGAIGWAHYNGLVKDNESMKRELIEKRLELERAVEANKNSQGVIKDLIESGQLNNRTVGGVRSDLQKQAKLIEEMKAEIRKMQGQAAPLTPPLKAGVTKMQELLDAAQSELKSMQAPPPLQPSIGKPEAKPEAKGKKPLTDLKPEGDAK